jgi:hypothetical protein
MLGKNWIDNAVLPSRIRLGNKSLHPYICKHYLVLIAPAKYFLFENKLSQKLEIAICTYLRIADKKAVIPVTGCFPVQLGV